MRHASNHAAAGLCPAVILKVGTLDDPSLFGSPQMAIYTIDKQAFHQIPEGMPSFERLPKRHGRQSPGSREPVSLAARPK